MVGPAAPPERTQSHESPRDATTTAWLGSAATTCFLCFFVGVVCAAVVVGVVVVGGVDCFGLGELLSCHAATAATIATMTPMATSGRRKPTPPTRVRRRSNRWGTSCGSSGCEKRLLYSST